MTGSEDNLLISLPELKDTCSVKGKEKIRVVFTWRKSELVGSALSDVRKEEILCYSVLLDPGSWQEWRVPVVPEREHCDPLSDEAQRFFLSRDSTWKWEEKQNLSSLFWPFFSLPRPTKGFHLLCRETLHVKMQLKWVFKIYIQDICVCVFKTKLMFSAGCVEALLVSEKL